MTSAAMITGYGKEEMLDKALGDFIRQEHKESVQRVLAAALQGTDTATFELALATKEGECVLLSPSCPTFPFLFSALSLFFFSFSIASRR